LAERKLTELLSDPATPEYLTADESYRPIPIALARAEVVIELLATNISEQGLTPQGDEPAGCARLRVDKRCASCRIWPNRQRSRRPARHSSRWQEAPALTVCCPPPAVPASECLRRRIESLKLLVPQ
jgi:hypothetical protein